MDRVLSPLGPSRCAAAGLLLSLAVLSTAQAAVVQLHNKYDFLKASIVHRDYTGEMCSTSASGPVLPECIDCELGGSCTIGMFGFESRVAQASTPGQSTDLTRPVTALVSSFIGSPTFVAGHFISNSTSAFLPSFDQSYVAPVGQARFFDVVLRNRDMIGPNTRDTNLDAPPYVYSASTYSGHDTELDIIATLKEVIEYDDRNNNGIYDAAFDGAPARVIPLKCFNWTKAVLVQNLNNTEAFSGEVSTWTLSTRGWQKAASNYAECTEANMPDSIPAGFLSINVSTATMPHRSAPREDTSSPQDHLLTTQHGLTMQVHMRSFPFRNTQGGDVNARVRPRIAFRFYASCTDRSAAFMLFDQRKLVNRKNPSNAPNGYIEWQPNALVKFPGSQDVWGSRYSLQPLRPTRTVPADAGMPGAGARDGYMPKVTGIENLPYSATVDEFREAYERDFVDDLILNAGGQAFNPSEIIFEIAVAYGPEPQVATWAAQPVVILGMLLVVIMTCACSYGGYFRERDLQTGYSRADYAEDELYERAKRLPLDLDVEDIADGDEDVQEGLLEELRGLQDRQSHRFNERENDKVHGYVLVFDC